MLWGPAATELTGPPWGRVDPMLLESCDQSVMHAQVFGHHCRWPLPQLVLVSSTKNKNRREQLRRGQAWLGPHGLKHLTMCKLGTRPPKKSSIGHRTMVIDLSSGFDSSTWINLLMLVLLHRARSEPSPKPTAATLERPRSSMSLTVRLWSSRSGRHSSETSV